MTHKIPSEEQWEDLIGKVKSILDGGDETVEQAAPSSSFTLAGALLGQPSNLSLYGDTEQDGTPSPSDPVAVETVTGEQVVGIVGKNLFNPSAKDGSYHTTYSFTKNTFTVTATETTAPYVVLPFGGRELLGKTITVSYLTSYIGASSASTPLIALHSPGSNAVGTTITSLQNGEGKKTITVTLPDSFTGGSSEFCIVFYAPSTIGASSVIEEMQVELGAAATDFEPYTNMSYTVNLGAIELCKFGDYRDYIYKNGNSWYLHKVIGRVTLDGLENWSANASQTGGYIIPYGTSSPFYNYARGSKTTSNGLCSHLKFENSFTTWTHDNCCGFNTSSTFWVKTPEYATLTDFTNWLELALPVVHYTLETPTETRITNRTLISQLSAIELSTGDNIITVTSEGLPALLTVETFANTPNGKWAAGLVRPSQGTTQTQSWGAYHDRS